MASRLSNTFAELRQRSEGALIVFITAGDQPLEQLPELVELLSEAGADGVEVGIPFSDPFGEGPTIQASSMRALAAGVTTAKIFEAMSRCRKGVPLIPMGYANQAKRMGFELFAERASSAGAVGVILSDLVPEEADSWCEACERYALETIFLAAPTSSEDRLRAAVSRTSGFVYAVSRTGVTGSESAVPPEADELVLRIRGMSDKPVCVGFGVSTPEHVARICRVADGAIVGSALVRLLHEEWGSSTGRAKIAAYVGKLKAATKKVAAE